MLEGHGPHFEFIHKLMKRNSKAKIAEAERRLMSISVVCAQIVERRAQRGGESKNRKRAPTKGTFGARAHIQMTV